MLKTYKILLLFAATIKAAIHIVSVSENGSLRFDPDTITATANDLIQFKFYDGSGAHSVVSSTFEKPCSPANDYFNSGSQRGDRSGETIFTVKINNTDPVWYYSSQGSNCPKGMVGVINPPTGKTVHDYAAQAQSALVVEPSNIVGGNLEGGAVTTQGVTTGTSSVPGFSAETTMPTTTTTPTTSTGVGSATIIGSAAVTSVSESMGCEKNAIAAQILGFIIWGLVALTA